MTEESENLLLKDQIAIVTGANRGIGKAVCEKFMEHGAQVIACVRTVCPSLQEWAEPRGVLHQVELDLRDDDVIKQAVKSVRSLSSKPDILVNCAGIASGGLFQMASMQEMRSVFDVNFFGLIAFSQGVSRLMARQKSGAIVNISSATASYIASGTLSYGAGKAALERATQSMAMELGAMGIRVNAVAPGVTQTDMADLMDEQALSEMVNRSALKKVAQPEDIANAALFLASGLSTHLTGQILHVDGGLF
ncbi:MAG: SDR family oxidoreductase [Methylocystaceae bacterium]|nr:SDR family oxidoreductase [Methylocystaceae bacterium]